MKADIDSDAGNYTFSFSEITMPSQDEAKGSGLAAWVFGGILVLFFMAIIWFRPEIVFGGPQQKILRVLTSVFVGVISYFFTGSLKLGGKVPLLNDVQISAVGGFAGFALAFFLW